LLRYQQLGFAPFRSSASATSLKTYSRNSYHISNIIPTFRKIRLRIDL
jgi:hypothetical protein